MLFLFATVVFRAQAANTNFLSPYLPALDPASAYYSSPDAAAPLPPGDVLGELPPGLGFMGSMATPQSLPLLVKQSAQDLTEDTYDPPLKPSFVTPAPFAFPHLHIQKAPPPPAAGAPADTPVNVAICDQLKTRIDAMSCSLVTYVSGVPEGCECQMTHGCPPYVEDLGFTGMSPSDTINLPEMGDISVTLCMYWQWKGDPTSFSEDAAEHQGAVERAKAFVKKAVDDATAKAEAAAARLWALTPSPPPPPPITTTPAPCDK